MAAAEAGDCYVGLPALADAGAAVGAGDEEGVAASADPPAEVPGEVGAVACADPPGEVYVPLGALGVGGVCCLGLSEEDAYALLGDVVSVGHLGWPFFGLWVVG